MCRGFNFYSMQIYGSVLREFDFVEIVSFLSSVWVKHTNSISNKLQSGLKSKVKCTSKNGALVWDSHRYERHIQRLVLEVRVVTQFTKLLLHLFYETYSYNQYHNNRTTKKSQILLINKVSNIDFKCSQFLLVILG